MVSSSLDNTTRITDSIKSPSPTKITKPKKTKSSNKSKKISSHNDSSTTTTATSTNANSTVAATSTTTATTLTQVLPKQRKEYTIQQKREKWSDEEHEKFLEAIRQNGRDWKKVEEFIGTKTRKQIRSHAQKHFEKMKKTGEEFPAPRAKKKSSRPYPSKKTNEIHNALSNEQIVSSLQNIPKELFENLIAQHDVTDAIRLIQLLVSPESAKSFSEQEKSLIRTIIHNANILSEKQKIQSSPSTESTNHLVFLLSIFTNFADLFENDAVSSSSKSSSNLSTSRLSTASTNTTTSTTNSTTTTSTPTLKCKPTNSNSTPEAKTNTTKENFASSGQTQHVDMTEWSTIDELDHFSNTIANNDNNGTAMSLSVGAVAQTTSLHDSISLAQATNMLMMMDGNQSTSILLPHLMAMMNNQQDVSSSMDTDFTMSLLSSPFCEQQQQQTAESDFQQQYYNCANDDSFSTSSGTSNSFSDNESQTFGNGFMNSSMNSAAVTMSTPFLYIPTLPLENHDFCNTYMYIPNNNNNINNNNNHNYFHHQTANTPNFEPTTSAVLSFFDSKESNLDEHEMTCVNTIFESY